MRKFCRVFLSRYAVSAILILLDIAFIALSGIYLSSLFPWLMVTALVVDVLVFFHLVGRDTNPEYKVPWMLVILLMPYFGVLLYVLFFTRKLTRTERRQLKKIAAFTPSATVRTAEIDRLSAEDAGAAGRALAILNDDPSAVVYRHTEATYFDDGEDMFRAMLADLRTAENFIFIETFIIEGGVMWTAVHDILRQKLAAGVEVRLLYDDIGCMSTLPSHYYALLRVEGIKAYPVSKVSPQVTVAHNHRDHRKIMVVDGKVAYTGGINIADEYIHAKTRFGVWKDGGIRLSGAAVDGLTRLFLATFDLTARTLTDPAFYSPSHPATDAPGYYIPFGSGPLPLYRTSVGKNAFLNLINRATDYLYVTTPYLIMDYDLTEAFCNAARRGADVRIFTPHVPDKPLILFMTRSAYPHLIEAGVRIFEYTPGFLHEKVLVTDDAYAIVGTINLDYRSFAHHFEDAVWMYRTPAVAAIREGVMKTLHYSEEITAEDARLSVPKRAVRNLIRLFAPLL